MTFARPFFTLSGLGLLGVLAMIPVLERAVAQLRQLPNGPQMPDAALTAILLVQPTLFLLVAVALGVALAEKAGLTSLLLRRLRGRAISGAGAWAATLLVAIAAATAVAAADLILRHLFPASLAGLPRLDDATLSVVGLLYGGITEELMMRFGLMTLLLWLGIRLAGNRNPFIVWLAILLSALAFAAGHLPALTGMGPPDTVLIVRTLGLNAALGLIYGWLYAYRSLEHAMLAHAASHVVFWAVTPLLVALGL
ncbi:CPBP family intramembrane glutamic endopeptidase [Microvirga alba]|uniref:CPBP family intramembrane metalloprotease n=1 Tax=Microvirga alba TaxID=2791025 RepID=A0A931BNH3_9HYPH|nr:CPBP family intramembrane glutamic endopeptidase [Microvirga alba]MBF9233188.1 CPBP family intramembrane metalloprotease [Microvirga alba]